MEEQKQLTKKCPFCSEEIKAEAVKCKHCGSILDKQFQNQEESKQKKPMFHNSCNLGCVAILIIVGIIVVVIIGIFMS